MVIKGIVSNFLMQGVILRRCYLEWLYPKNAPVSLVTYARARTFASKALHDRGENVIGVTGRRRRSKNKSKNNVKDPDEEFLQMWSTTEGYIQDQIKEATTGVKMSRRKYVKVYRPNVSTLPLVSELTMEERRDLLEDDMSVGFRIPKAGDFASLIPAYKSLNEEENVGDHDVETGEDERKEDKSDEGKSDDSDTSKILSFTDLNLHPKLVGRLKQYRISVPTPIQKQAIPLIMKNKSILIHSETGSGKTLVFLLPAIQDPGKRFGTVIVVPTRELASQMLFEAHRLLGDKNVVESFVSMNNLSAYLI